MQNDSPTVTSKITPMSWQNFLATIVTGFFIGAIVWSFTYVISEHALPRLLCEEASTILLCTQASTFSSNLATIFGALLGVLLLLKFDIFRPLLVVVVTAIALWSIEKWVQGGQWYEPLLLTAALYSLSYATFAWFARITFLRIAIILITLTIIIVRAVPILF